MYRSRDHALNHQVAESTIDVLSLLNVRDAESLSMPPYSYVVLLYQYNDPSVSICMLIETEKDWISWGMALRAHMRHYFHAVLIEELDVDDDAEG